MNELLVKKANLLEQARTALAAGNLEEGRKLRQEAEQVQALLDESAAVNGMIAKSIDAQRPPLPGTQGNGTFGPSQPAQAQQPTEGAVLGAQAAYVKRFGEPDAAIKAILTDLHGKDYVQAYQDQRSAFKAYLRRGENGIGYEATKLLKSIILTPAAVSDALEQGADSVAALKATMVEAIDTLGGFAVPVDFQSRVIERMQGLTIMRGKASVDKTSRDMVEIPVSTGGDDQYTSAVRVTWVDETPVAGQSATNLTFGLESIPIHTVMAETGLGRNRSVSGPQVCGSQRD
jgi:HK97 family phage major capsid protein